MVVALDWTNTMATDFIMPRLPDAQTSSHYFNNQPPPAPAQSPSFAPPHQTQGYQSQQVSPLSTSNNVSPTSLASFQPQRLRPMFMPAVLRPTEHPYKREPGNKRDVEGSDDDRPLSSANSLISLPGLGSFGRLSRRSTNGTLDGEWNLDLFPKPTAQPTRQHWKVRTGFQLSALSHFCMWPPLLYHVGLT